MSSLAIVLANILRLYQFIIIARVLLSYFPNVDYSNPIVKFLIDVTEPVLQPVRQFLREQFPDSGPLDLSPIVVIIGIFLLTNLIFAVF